MLNSVIAEAEPSLTPRNGERLDLACAGVQVRIEGPSSFIEELPDNFIPGCILEFSHPVDVTFTVHIDNMIEIQQNGEQVGVFCSLSSALEALQLTAQRMIAARATELLFIHAGVAAYKGTAIVIPGRSHTGKTSLVMALCNAGADYYSDNYALVDGNGFIHPFARLPRVREQLAPIPLICGVSRPPLPASLIVLTQFEPAATWKPEQLSAGQRLFGLIENSVAIRSYPELYMSRLTKLATTARGYSSPRGEARLVAEAILSELQNTDPNLISKGEMH